VEAKRTCALSLFLLAVKNKAVIVSFRLDTKILTADRTAGSAALCKGRGAGEGRLFNFPKSGPHMIYRKKLAKITKRHTLERISISAEIPSHQSICQQ